MYLYLAYFSALIVLVPLTFGYSKRRHLAREFKPFFYLLLISLVVDVSCIILGAKGVNNMFLMNAFLPIEFLFIVVFYKRFFDSFLKSIIHYLVLFLFFILLSFEAFVMRINGTFNYSNSVEFIILIIYSLISFLFIMKNLVYNNLLETPFFWINSSVLIYFSGNLFLFIFSRYVQTHYRSDFKSLFAIHSILHIIYYSLISVGFWKAKAK